MPGGDALDEGARAAGLALADICGMPLMDGEDSRVVIMGVLGLGDMWPTPPGMLALAAASLLMSTFPPSPMPARPDIWPMPLWVILSPKLWGALVRRHASLRLVPARAAAAAGP